MPVSISGDGTFAGLTSVKTVNVLHPDAVTNNIVLADDGSVTLDSIPASIQSAIDGIPQISGIGSNVVQTVKTDVFSSSSTSFVDITGLSVVITPTSATSKVLVVANFIMGEGTGSFVIQANLRRGSTNIAQSVSATNATWSYGESAGGQQHAIAFLDSPATTSATTYSVQGRTSAGTFHVGRAANIAWGAVSVITAIEVAA
jgi:hypothetical protein